jgi:hypothetical protein
MALWPLLGAAHPLGRSERKNHQRNRDGNLNAEGPCRFDFGNDIGQNGLSERHAGYKRQCRGTETGEAVELVTSIAVELLNLIH